MEEAKNERKNIGKKVRFEVFKRDGFCCQYCGAKAPDVVLEVDHIEPVSKGGDNDLMNLITACRGCNAGKSDVRLDDDTAIQKQRAMLEDLSERREQLEMMLAWRTELKGLDDEVLGRAAEHWNAMTPGVYLNEAGLKELRTLLRKVGLEKVLDAMDEASKHLTPSMDGEGVDVDSANIAWSKVGAIAKAMCKPEYEQKLRYIRGICRNRFTYCNDRACLALLKEAYEAGVDIDDLAEIAKSSRNWTGWQQEMWSVIDNKGDI